MRVFIEFAHIIWSIIEKRLESSQFKGLNGLRFPAALLVLMHHCYQECVKIGLCEPIARIAIFDHGTAAVNFFFTLSGFLISYLLLREYDAEGTIGLRNFYMRRACRIWPLYLVVLATGVFLLAFLYPRMYHERYFDFPLGFGLLMYAVFLPNWM